MAIIQIKVPNWLDKIFTWPVTAYRRRKYGFPYRRINLGEGQWAILDSTDYFRLKNFKWYLSGNGYNFYAFRNIIVGPKRTKMLSMHREIMNEPAGRLVDHRNRNSLDNRRDNLRLATPSQNACNCRKDKSKDISKFTGSYFDKNRIKWRSVIHHLGKSIFLGYFDSETDAAKAYDAAAKKYHGEFAKLNFPEKIASTR